MEDNLEKKEEVSQEKEAVESVQEVKEENIEEKKDSVIETDNKEVETVCNSNKKNSKFGFIKLIWNIIKIVLIIIFGLILAVILVQRVSHNKASVGGYGIYTVVSESMVPEYNIWDMLFAKKVDPATIRVGDDVVYQGKEGDFVDKIVTHRVMRVIRQGNNYNFITKGIANDVEDPEITADQIYGKVVLKSVILTKISKTINTTYGFYFIIFVPFVVIVTLEIIDTVNERKKLKKELE